MAFIKRIETVGKRMRELQRFREIVRVFVQYGYDDLAHKLHIPAMLGHPIKSLMGPRDASISKLSQAEKLRCVCEALGPTFVKLGQILSTRPNLLPEDYIRELAKLHSHASALPFDQIRSILEEELGAPPDSLLKSLDATPLGAASIAQVHRATLQDGKAVVVKIQRPGIDRVMEQDLEILEYLAQLMEHHLESWRIHRPSKIVEEFAMRLSKELDFNLEASHVQRFRWQCRDNLTVHVPKVYESYTHRRVLIMDYVEGTKISEWLQTATDDQKSRIADTIAQSVMEQIFLHGFFHADPHPGNIHIMPDATICFLDFGMMGFLDFRTREALADLLWNIYQKNESGVTHALLRLGSTDVEPDLRQLESDVAAFMHQHFYRPLSGIRFGTILGQLLAITGRHHLTLPPDIFVMLKTLGHTESLLRQLKPDQELLQFAAPMIKQLRLHRIHPKQISGSLYDLALEMGQLVQDFPSEWRRLMGHLKSGEAKVAFKHDGLEPLTSSWDRISNRISFSLVLASLIIGSSLLVHADLPPKWNEIPIIGVFGFVMAALMGFWLLVSILRHGRM